MSKKISWSAVMALPVLLLLGAAKTDHPAKGASLSDAEVLHALVAANKGEVSYSQMGIDKAHSADVKAFATDMVTMHGAALAHAQTAAANHKMGSDASRVSVRLQADEKKAEALLKVHGDSSDYDLYFMCGQVRLHQGVLKAIDDTLLPSAKAQDVRDEVTNTRPVVNDHLKRAQTLVEKLGGGSETSSTSMDKGSSMTGTTAKASESVGASATASGTHAKTSGNMASSGTRANASSKLGGSNAGIRTVTSICKDKGGST
jgi:predicted outer membrane protein